VSKNAKKKVAAAAEGPSAPSSKETAGSDKTAGSGKPTASTFPGGKAVPEPGELRIAVDKAPYSEILGHAILEPEVEVCGVLVGALGEDEHGPFVHVRHAIRGQSARQEGAAVTFTHETWNHIHQEMDQKYPDQQIVGWYHTHGGFGVFLSEMDTFVHQNFFPEPHHLAYVYDPLAGSEGFFLRQDGELKPVRRYWLGGRERRPAMRMPEPEPKARPAPAAGADGGGGGGDMASAVTALEKLAVSLQWSAREKAAAPETSWTTYLPWLVAGVFALLFLLGPRSQPAAPEPILQRGAPLLVLEKDPQSGLVVGIPLELAQATSEAGAFLDQRGNLRVGIERGDAGALSQQLQAVARAELERQLLSLKDLEVARADQARLVRWVGLGAGVLAALVAAAAAAWYFLLRRG
jgi:proteasome lid subunit RPN8/RPN11